MRRASDRVLVGLAGLHGAVVCAAPSALVIAVGIWWNSNTIAHNFVHRPFFRVRSLNVLFAIGQSALLGVPQTIWRERHLAHHAGRRWRPRWSLALAAELVTVAGVWTAIGLAAPAFFAAVYLPGYLGGLVLCAVQGHYEHAGATTTSHYGRLYNLLCFNDGYHVEHHACPGVHWSALPGRVQPHARASRWPALLRWIDAIDLERLERLVLRSPWLQRFVVAAHRRAFRGLMAEFAATRRVAIVGGGLFPRTAIVLHQLLPDAELIIVDANARNLDAAEAFIGRSSEGLRRAVRFRHERFPAEPPIDDIDLLVVPLAFEGNRQDVYARPPARAVIVHDWLWRPRGRSRVVSALLLKRLNLVRP